jgi:hypothetical protein
LRTRTDGQDAWTGAYLDVLERRFRRLLSLWLDAELQRSPFTVLAPEQKQLLDIGPLQLSVRPDRLDRVDDGFVLIDYKSSATLSTKHWFGERPDAPQLPLYALLSEPDEIRGLAFARVRPGKSMGWLSLADTAGLFPKSKDNDVRNLEDEIQLWRIELERLAEAFAHGEAQVAPKLYPDTCQYCGQRLLCRLNPAALLGQAPDEASKTEETFG